VEKGCGKRMVLEAAYKDSATYNANRQCYATKVVKNNRVINNKFKEGNGTEPVLSNSTSTTTATSRQEELCFCEGSECNNASALTAEVLLVGSLLLLSIGRAV
jgi:hypothetical protein